MSTAGPSKPWYSRDLFQVLGWREAKPSQANCSGPRNPLGRWDELILANSAARREAKGALFAELAEATRQGMPLDQALFHSSQNLEEAKRRKRWSAFPPGAETRNRPLDLVVVLLITMFGHLAYFFYGLLALRMIDVERISRLLAVRLHRYVTCGYSLSEAMHRCRNDFDTSEVQMVEASEQWGTLPEGLKRLSQFQLSERQLTIMGTLALYPFWMGGLLLTIASFCLIFILPKFKDIYDQLGAELPAPTQLMLEWANFLVNSWLGLLLNLFWVLSLAFFILRGFMNGTRISKLLLGLGLCITIATTALSMTAAAADSNHHSTLSSDIQWLVLCGVMLIFLPLLVPYVLSAMEGFVLRLERWLRPLLRFLPIVGHALRVEREARWLGALSLALTSGVTPDRALRSAGKICGGDMERRSFQAAQLVESGHAIGAACIQAKVLRSQSNHRLALLDGRPDYLRGLRSIAEDSSQFAHEWLQRSGRVMEIFMVMALGVLAAFFVICMYLPLFNIPNIVGTQP